MSKKRTVKRGMRESDLNVIIAQREQVAFIQGYQQPAKVGFTVYEEKT